VIPSLHEQCSYVAIEMSMFGVPMIVSDVDALSEMFNDGVNALKVPLIFDADFGLEIDEDKLAASVIRLLEDDMLRKNLSCNVIENYHSNFTLEQMMERTMDLYQQLI
jgi:glycosyltransferase involved in cell wall biosynthesis